MNKIRTWNLIDVATLLSTGHGWYNFVSSFNMSPAAGDLFLCLISDGTVTKTDATAMCPGSDNGAPPVCLVRALVVYILLKFLLTES